jgi:hypothetical protein
MSRTPTAPVSPHIAALIASAQEYAARRNISEARLSTILFNDGKRLERLRDGRSDLTSRRLYEATTMVEALLRASA